MFRHLLVASVVGLVLPVVVVALLAVWGVGETRYQRQRVELAGAVLQDQLRLKADSYALFRRLSDGASGRVPRGALIADEAAERAAVMAILERVRSGIAREVLFSRERRDEAGEIDRLAEIERGLLVLLHEYRHARALADQGRGDEGHQRFDDALRALSGDGFRRLFDDAVAEEEQETRDARTEADRAMTRVALAATLGAVLAAVGAAAALSTLLRRLRRPVFELVETAQAVQAGKLERRVELEPGRQDVFARIADSVNAMIEEIARKRSAELETRRALEAEVAARTAEYRRANEALLRADDARRRFLADISHELRTPLTILRGEAEIVLRGNSARPPDEYRAALSRIVEQAQHTGQLVDDLLFVARSEAGEPRLTLQTLDFGKVVADAADGARHVAEAAGHRLVLHPAPDSASIDARVRGDPLRLNQLVTILLDNALRYSPQPGRITLALSLNGHVDLRVADQGIGITTDELPHVFQRFWRGSRASRLQAGGSGLGLPLAKAIVHAHAGQIGVHSSPGQGTTVTVTLPLLAREAGAEARQTTGGAAAVGRGEAR